MKKLFSIFLVLALLFSISLFTLSASAAGEVSVEIAATTSKGVRNVATSQGTLWSTQQDSAGFDVRATTYVYLYYTKDGKESYYADYKEANNVGSILGTTWYENMFVSVAKWSTDGSSNFHSTHYIYGFKNNKHVGTDKITVSVAEFGN